MQKDPGRKGALKSDLTGSQAAVDRKQERDASQDSEAPSGKPQGPLLSLTMLAKR